MVSSIDVDAKSTTLKFSVKFWRLIRHTNNNNNKWLETIRSRREKTNKKENFFQMKIIYFFFTIVCIVYTDCLYNIQCVQCELWIVRHNTYSQCERRRICSSNQMVSCASERCVVFVNRMHMYRTLDDIMKKMLQYGSTHSSIIIVISVHAFSTLFLTVWIMND